MWRSDWLKGRLASRLRKADRLLSFQSRPNLTVQPLTTGPMLTFRANVERSEPFLSQGGWCVEDTAADEESSVWVGGVSVSLQTCSEQFGFHWTQCVSHVMLHVSMLAKYSWGWWECFSVLNQSQNKLLNSCCCCARCKVQVIQIHPIGNIDICTKFNSNSLIYRQNVSLRTT